MNQYEYKNLELTKFQAKKILGDDAECMSSEELKNNLNDVIFNKIKEYADAQVKVSEHFDDTYKGIPFTTDESKERFELQQDAESKLLSLLEEIKNQTQS